MREHRFSDGGAALAAGRTGLQSVSSLFHQKGWLSAAGGSFSVVLERGPLRLLITADGRDKRRLDDADFAIVDEDGSPITASGPRASADARLHAILAARDDVGAVLHTHSVCATALSDAFAKRGAVQFRGFEMQKGLDGVSTHDSQVELPIFENAQDISSLSRQVRTHLDSAVSRPPPGFLIRSHGLFAWGRDLSEARRHVETLEFLLEATAMRSMIPTYKVSGPAEAAPSGRVS